MQDVFISYSTKDENLAFQIKKKLEDDGIKVWFAPRNIRKGHMYPYDIVEAIMETKFLLLLMSKNSLVSKNVERELMVADEEEKKVIPVFLDNSYEMKIYIKSSFRYYLIGKQRIDVDLENFEDSLNEISTVLNTEIEEEIRNEFNSNYNSEFDSRVQETNEYVYGVAEFIRKTNYWIFQGDQTETFLMNCLRDNCLHHWIVINHRNDIRIGDKAIIWMTGLNSGCYAICRITSNSTDRYRVNIEMLYNLYDNPILIEEVQKHKELEKLRDGIPGACFRLEENQFEKILRIRGL